MRLSESYTQDDSHFITLESGADIAGLSLMLPDNVASVQDKSTGAALPIRQVTLESRRQRAVTIDLAAASSLTLCLTSIA